MPRHFLPVALSPIISKICSSRETCSDVCRRCSSNPWRNAAFDEAFANLGKVFTSWVSALYRSLNSSTYSSRNESFRIMFLLVGFQRERGLPFTGYISKSMWLIRGKQYPRCCIEVALPDSCARWASSRPEPLFRRKEGSSSHEI